MFIASTVPVINGLLPAGVETIEALNIFASNARPKFLPAAIPAAAVPCPLVNPLLSPVPVPMVLYSV